MLEFRDGRTPLDPETLLPLPIFPDKNLPSPIPPSQPNIERKADWHHPNHPGPSLIGTEDGDAVRQDQLQWVLYKAHHIETDGYHRHCDKGPLVEPDRAGRFGRTIIQVARCIPKWALDFSGSEPQIVPLSRPKRALMHARGDIRVASLSAVKVFWLSHLLEQFDLRPDDINQDKVENFRRIRADSPYERPLGALLKHLTELAVQPHRDRYTKAYSQGLMPPDAKGEPTVLVHSIMVGSGLSAIRAKVQRAAAQYRRGEVVVPLNRAAQPLQEERIPA